MQENFHSLLQRATVY